MADESNEMPTSQIVRWLVVGLLILGAAGLYFTHGRTLPPLAPAADEIEPPSLSP
jgi:hypothetical protein